MEISGEHENQGRSELGVPNLVGRTEFMQEKIKLVGELIRNRRLIYQQNRSGRSICRETPSKLNSFAAWRNNVSQFVKYILVTTLV